MARRSFTVVNAEINRLRRYLEENIDKNDTEIITALEIKPRTFYYYKEKIREQDRQAWTEMAKETLEERAAKIMKAIDFAQKINKEIAEHSPDHRARIEAAKQVIQNNVWAKELLERGPKVMHKIEGHVIVEPEVKALEPVRQSSV